MADDEEAGVAVAGGSDAGLPFIVSSRLQMRLLIPSGSSGSLELWLEPLAVTVDVVGRLDASDCVRFANDVIVVRAV